MYQKNVITKKMAPRFLLLIPLLSSTLSTYTAYGTQLNNVILELRRLNAILIHKFGSNSADITVFNNGPAANTVQIVQQGPEIVNALPTAAAAQPKQSGWRGRLKNWFSKKTSTAPQQGPLGFLYNNKREVLVKGSCAGLLYLNYLLFQTRQYLQEAPRWSLWKSHIPSPQLFALPAEELQQELIFEVKRRYGTSGNDLDFVKTLLASLEDEQIALARYEYLSSYIAQVDAMQERCFTACSFAVPKIFGISSLFMKKCTSLLGAWLRISTLFYLDQQLIDNLTDRQSRLAYLRQLIGRWINSAAFLEAQAEPPRKFKKPARDAILTAKVSVGEPYARKSSSPYGQ